MNLLLLDDAEVTGSRILLTGRRAEHLSRVLGVCPGDSVRAGIVRKGLIDARIEATGSDGITLRLGAVQATVPPSTHVVLALPRPKVLSRSVTTVASFCVKSLTLINSWRVEKSYFSSKKLHPVRLAEDALLGAKQGGHVWPPEIRIVDSFRRYVEDIAPRPGSKGAQLVLHPGSALTMAQAVQGQTQGAECFLALGPEGGFIQSELDSWCSHGWSAVDLGTPTLRTEAAIAAALGQLALVQGSPSRRF